MKRLLSFAVVFAILGLFSASCSSEYDASPDVAGKDTIRNPLQGDFTATVNGIPFTADTKYFTDDRNGDTRYVTISGVQDSYNKNPKNNQTISITIPIYTGPHSYPIDGGFGGGATAMYSVMDSGVVTTYIAKPNDSLSSVNITNDGDKWEGTFNFVAAPNGSGDENNQSIADGSFSIPK